MAFDLIHIISTLLISFSIAALFFPVWIKLLNKWRLFDSPGSHKIHDTYKPSLGGLVIFMAVILSVIIVVPISSLSAYKYLILSLGLMFITGLRDDILTLNPTQKMIGQFLPILILVFLGNTLLNSFYELIPNVSINYWLAAGITVFTFVILTNSFNLIDGLDGLAGSVTSLLCLWYGWWFYQINQPVLSIFSLAFLGATLAFLIYNWSPSKIFMGDTGALTLGLFVTYLTIEFINFNYKLPIENEYKFRASIVSAICFMIIPILDTTRVIIIRLRKFSSPFKADKNHLHHQFINLGLGHAGATLWISSINVFTIGLAWILRNQSDVIILPIVIGLCLIINYALKLLVKKYSKNEGEGRRA